MWGDLSNSTWLNSRPCSVRQCYSLSHTKKSLVNPFYSPSCPPATHSVQLYHNENMPLPNNNIFRRPETIHAPKRFRFYDFTDLSCPGNLYPNYSQGSNNASRHEVNFAGFIKCILNNVAPITIDTSFHRSVAIIILRWPWCKC